MPENKEECFQEENDCSTCVNGDLVDEARTKGCGSCHWNDKMGIWTQHKPNHRRDKRVFNFGQFSFKTQAEFSEFISKLWAEGKTPTVTVEVLK